MPCLAPSPLSIDCEASDDFLSIMAGSGSFLFLFLFFSGKSQLCLTPAEFELRMMEAFAFERRHLVR